MNNNTSNVLRAKTWNHCIAKSFAQPFLQWCKCFRVSFSLAHLTFFSPSAKLSPIHGSFLFFYPLNRMGSDFFHFLNGPNLPLPLLKFYGESDVYGIFPDLISCCFSPFFIFRKKRYEGRIQSHCVTLFPLLRTGSKFMGPKREWLFFSLPFS